MIHMVSTKTIFQYHIYHDQEEVIQYKVFNAADGGRIACLCKTLRHTWASWLAQNGVPLSDIQEMGGWETYAMVKRYAHLLPAHLAHRARVIDELMNTNSAQLPKSESVSH